MLPAPPVDTPFTPPMSATRRPAVLRLWYAMWPVSDSAARRLAAQAAARQNEAEAAIAGDPFVLQLMREFGGKIVPGSVRPV